MPPPLLVFFPLFCFVLLFFSFLFFTSRVLRLFFLFHFFLLFVLFCFLFLGFSSLPLLPFCYIISLCWVFFSFVFLPHFYLCFFPRLFFYRFCSFLFIFHLLHLPLSLPTVAQEFISVSIAASACSSSLFLLIFLHFFLFLMVFSSFSSHNYLIFRVGGSDFPVHCTTHVLLPYHDGSEGNADCYNSRIWHFLLNIMNVMNMNNPTMTTRLAYAYLAPTLYVDSP